MPLSLAFSHSAVFSAIATLPTESPVTLILIDFSHSACYRYGFILSITLVLRCSARPYGTLPLHLCCVYRVALSGFKMITQGAQLLVYRFLTITTAGQQVHIVHSREFSDIKLSFHATDINSSASNVRLHCMGGLFYDDAVGGKALTFMLNGL